MRGKPGQDLKGIGRNGHLDTVVLCCPDHMEACVLRYLHHLGHVARDF